MTLVNERTGDRSGAGIQIFVRTPNSKVDIPVMQMQLEISGGVCEIETPRRSGFVSGLGDRRHVERLTGVIIHTAEQHECDLICVTFDRFDYVFGTKSLFAIPGSELDQVLILVLSPALRRLPAKAGTQNSVKFQLRFNRVLIR